jgi:aldose 1-epimerase
VEVGGGLRSFAVDGVDVLLGYAVEAMCTSGRGQVLAPWPNRIVDGRYTFDGVEHELPITERGRSTAIHGLVRWANWTATARTESSVTLAHTLHPQPGYPFTVGLEVAYELDDKGLHVTTRAENLGDTACPFGVGHHPYIACRVDDLVGDAKLDETRTGLERFQVGSVEVWWDESFPYVQVFSGDLPDVQRLGLAVEPMTCPPNAFNTGEGLLRLEPGDRFEGSWGIRVTQSP